jgi:hypothetical protein
MMNAKTRKYRYLEWYSPEEMHEETVKWFSQLKFARDEQLFLNNLVKEQTMKLTDTSVFEESKTVVNSIVKMEKEIVPLLKQVQAHEIKLIIMLDVVDQLKMEKEYMDTHRELLISVNQYLSQYQEVKRKLFQLVSRQLKKEKQRRLLH